MKTALYTGSFDPITKGHLDIIKRASQIFGKVIVGVGNNPSKNHTFDLKQRIEFIEANIKDYPNVSVTTVAGGRLSADVAFENNAVIIKGVRVNTDYDYEKMAHDIGVLHSQGMETVLFIANPKLAHISSSAAKQVCEYNGTTEEFVPLNVKAALERKHGQYRIGITGSIATGKSTLTGYLCQNTGALNIDLDVIARDILFTRQEPAYVDLRHELQTKLGMTEWNRKALGVKVFGLSAFRNTVDQALKQPLMTEIRRVLSESLIPRFIIFNSALLCEAQMLALVNNRVIVTHCSEETQLARLKARGHNEEQCNQRILAQGDANWKARNIVEQICKDGYGAITMINTDKPNNEARVGEIRNFIYG